MEEEVVVSHCCDWLLSFRTNAGRAHMGETGTSVLAQCESERKMRCLMMMMTNIMMITVDLPRQAKLN